MRVPDPKANTTTEAYLAYKAGYLEESELKPKLYEPYLHFDAWLAYWAGLTNEYPSNVSKRNVLQLKDYSAIGIDVKLAAGGMISVSGTTQNNYANFMTYQTPIDLKAGVYTFSRVGDKTYAVSLTVYNENKTQYTSISIAAGNSSTTANVAFDIKYIAGAFTGLTVGSNLDFTTGLQLEAGSEASEFEPYAIPEMLTDEEALVAYLSGVTDTYPEEIKDPYDVRIVGYLKYLVSARWGRPEYPVNNEEFYLSTMDAPHTSNETPSADIELDTSEGKLIDVKAYGDTYQQTYSGKNLWQIRKENQTVGQVTYTYNQDGTFSLSGDPTEVGTVKVIVPLASSGITPGQTYTIWTDHGIGWGENQVMYYIQSCKADGTWVANIATFTSGARTQTVASTDEQYIMFVLSWSAKGNYTNFNNVKTQLVAGSTTDSDFEPYTGGIPAPNPDYPQDIQVVTGEQTVNVHGKNLFDTDDRTQTRISIDCGTLSNRVTVNGTAIRNNFGGSYWNINGTNNASANYYNYDNTTSGTTLRAGTYTLSINNVSGSYTTPNQVQILVTSVYSGSYPIPTLATITLTNNQTSATFTLAEETTVKIQFRVVVSSDTSVAVPVFDNYSFDLQLELGSSATSYQPYQSHDYTVNLGSKNLWPTTPYSVGFVLLYPDGTNFPYTGGEIYRQDNVVVGAKYTLTTTPSVNGNMRVFAYKSDGTTISQIGVLALTAGARNSITVTIPAETAYIKWSFVTGMTDSQLELGGQSTAYEPYSPYNYELCKIGTYQDYIYKSGDDWYVHKETASMVFNGSENWSSPDNFNLTNTNVYYLVTTITCKDPVMSSHFRNSSYIRTADVSGICGTIWDLPAYRISNTVVTSVAEWQTWLSTHNMETCYVLKTPTDTQITDSTLIAQLNALAGADTYNEKTYIKVTANDPNLPALLKVEAYKY